LTDSLINRIAVATASHRGIVVTEKMTDDEIGAVFAKQVKSIAMGADLDEEEKYSLLANSGHLMCKRLGEVCTRCLARNATCSFVFRLTLVGIAVNPRVIADLRPLNWNFNW
jgi:hypothetical protein